jgi:hypothetical protein
MLALLLLGCPDPARHAVPLLEVPVVGGTEAQREAVRRELLAFSEATGEGRVTLTEIRLLPMEGKVGTYSQLVRDVFLDEEEPDLGYIVRHELCHALVHQEELAAQPDLVLDPATLGLFDPDFEGAPSMDSPGRSTAESWRSELVASFCEMGPYGAAFAAVHDCPLGESDPDPAQRRALGAWLMAHVWRAFVLPEPLRLDALPVVAAQAEVRSPVLGVSPTAATDVIRADDGLYFDLYTGEVVPSDLPALESSHDGPAGLGSFFVPDERGLAGWEEGPSAAMGGWYLYHLGSQEAFLVAAPEWRLVDDGCPQSGHDLFTADDQVWVAWREDEQLLWTSLGAR